MSLISLNRPAITDIDWTGAPSRPHTTEFYRAASAALRLLHRTGVAIARWWSDRRAMQMLARADGAILRDLGITREDIERVVRDGRDPRAPAVPSSVP